MINMDIFDVLKAVSKRKMDLTQKGMDERHALKSAEIDISNEYHIPLHDIRKLYNI